MVRIIERVVHDTMKHAFQVSESVSKIFINGFHLFSSLGKFENFPLYYEGLNF